MRSPLPGTGPRTVERGDASSTDSPTAADGAPADGARTDAVLTTPEQRAAAHRRYRDSDTRSITRMTWRGSRPERTRDRRTRSTRTTRELADAGDEGATRDADAEPSAHGEAADAEAPHSVDTRPRDADSEPREAEAPEAKDTEARDAWAEALPGLRAEWEKHEREFPERSRSAPSSQADGGWLGDGDRRLTPGAEHGREQGLRGHPHRGQGGHPAGDGAGGGRRPGPPTCGAGAHAQGRRPAEGEDRG